MVQKNLIKDSKRTNRSAEQVKEIRRRFLEDYNENKELYSKDDVDRVIQSDWFVKRFYISKKKNVDEALKMIIRTLRWRMEMEVPLIADWMFPIEFYKIGGLFIYENDKEGNLVVYMRTCMHRKIPELEEYEKKFILKIFDKVDKLTDGNGFSIIFDLTNTGYSNVDLDFLKFLINCTTYYPVGLKYILVYNLPWVLNAIRKTVMLIMPEDLMGILKFGSGNEIFNYIDKCNVPDFLNGTCKRNYRQIPQKCRPVTDLVEEFGMTEADVNRIMPNFKDLLIKADLDLQNNEYIDLDNFYDEPDEEDLRDFSEMNKLKLQLKNGAIKIDFYKKKLDEKLQRFYNKAAQKQDSNKNQSETTSLPNQSIQKDDAKHENLFNVIKVTPDKLLYFIYDSSEKVYKVQVCIENNTNQNVAFKIQSTEPNNYSVSPCQGIILAKKTIFCSISTLKSKINIPLNDKFLILATRVDKNEMKVKEFNLIWNSNADSIESVCLKSRKVLSKKQRKELSPNKNNIENIDEEHKIIQNIECKSNLYLKYLILFFLITLQITLIILMFNWQDNLINNFSHEKSNYFVAGTEL